MKHGLWWCRWRIFWMLVKLYVREDKNFYVYWWSMLVKTFLYVGDSIKIQFHAYSPTYISPKSRRSRTCMSVKVFHQHTGFSPTYIFHQHWNSLSMNSFRRKLPPCRAHLSHSNTNVKHVTNSPVICWIIIDLYRKKTYLRKPSHIRI